MFIVANFISAVATVTDMLLTVYLWIVVVRSLISWVNPDPYNPIVQMLYRLTEPVMAPIRRRLSGFSGAIDFSPLIVIAGIYFLKAFLVASLLQLSMRIH